MNINRRPNLTPEEKTWITENAHNHTIKQMAKELNIPYQTVRTYCNKEKLDYVITKIWKKEKTEVAESDYFDISSYTCWITGLKLAY